MVKEIEEELDHAYFDEESREYVFESVSSGGDVSEIAAQKSLMKDDKMAAVPKSDGWKFRLYSERFDIHAVYEEAEDEIRVSVDGMELSNMRELALEGTLNLHPKRDSLYKIMDCERGEERDLPSRL